MVSIQSKKDNQLVDIQEWVSIRWENSLKKRYYLVMIQQDIFGQWILIRTWGGIQKKLGGSQVTVLENKTEGIDMLEAISIRRKKRGYTII